MRSRLTGTRRLTFRGEARTPACHHNVGYLHTKQGGLGHDQADDTHPAVLS